MACYNGTRHIFLSYTWMLSSSSSRSKWPVHLENVRFYTLISRYIYRYVWVICTASAHATSSSYNPRTTANSGPCMIWEGYRIGKKISHISLMFTKKPEFHRSKFRILVSNLVGRLQIYEGNSKLIGHVISFIICKVSSFIAGGWSMQHLSVRVVAAFHFWQIKGEFSFHGRTHAIHLCTTPL